jgi:hypothetical protein
VSCIVGFLESVAWNVFRSVEEVVKDFEAEGQEAALPVCAAYMVTPPQALPNIETPLPLHDDTSQVWMDKARGLPGADKEQTASGGQPEAASASPNPTYPPESAEQMGKTKSTALVASMATTLLPASSFEPLPLTLPMEPLDLLVERQAAAPPNTPTSSEMESKAALPAPESPKQMPQHFALHPLFPHLPADAPLTYTLTMQACLCEMPCDRPSFSDVVTLLQTMQNEVSSGQYLNSEGILQVRSRRLAVPGLTGIAELGHLVATLLAPPGVCPHCFVLKQYT